MQAFTIFTLVAAAVSAYAAPTEQPQPGQSCGNNQQVSCCETGDSVLSILGGACTLPLLGQSCQGSRTFCCDAHQNGLINLGSICLPIQL